ncbi:hypothetical protein YQE_00301, partial [Dendroctonus ponderosae]
MLLKINVFPYAPTCACTGHVSPRKLASAKLDMEDRIATLLVTKVYGVESVRTNANAKIMPLATLSTATAPVTAAGLVNFAKNDAPAVPMDRTAWKNAGVRTENAITYRANANATQATRECDDPCPIGTHGYDCKSKCPCQNGGTCHSVTGVCFCKDGWTGQVCANRCPFGFWGYNCSQKCDCYNGASCHHINGTCECQPGFTGDRVVAVIVAIGDFFVSVWTSVLMVNGARIALITVRARMTPNVRTKMDRVVARRAGLEKLATRDHVPRDFGASSVRTLVNATPTTLNCELISFILHQSAKQAHCAFFRCHAWTGECDCKPGWNSKDCTRPCPILSFGKACAGTCKCDNNAQCSPINGTCLCGPGITGKQCEQPCPLDSFGMDCAQKCDCTFAEINTKFQLLSRTGLRVRQKPVSVTVRQAGRANSATGHAVIINLECNAKTSATAGMELLVIP